MIHKAPLSMKDLPSLRQLRAFVAIYESGQISAAAEILSITQPAATVLLRELEDRMGVRLFERTTRALRRTEAAVLAFEFAQRALAEIEAMGRSMSQVAAGRAGSLRIAVTGTTIQTILPTLMSRYLRSYPEIKITLEECSPMEFAQRISDERVDVGIGRLTKPIPGFLEHVISTDELVAVGLPDDLLPKDEISWNQMATKPAILVQRGYALRRTIDAAAAEAQVELQIAYEVSLVTTALALAGGGLGVAVVPRKIVPTCAVKDLAVCTLTHPKVLRNTSLIHRSDRNLTPTAAAFLQTALCEQL